MYIFQKRPLSFILCVWLGGFFAFSSVSGYQRLALIALVPILFSLPFLFRSLASKRTLIILSSIALALSFLMSFAYFDLYFKADKRFEGEANIVGTVVSSEPESSRSTAIIIKSDNVNGEYLSKYTFVMRMKNSDMPLLEVGDLVSFSADLVG